MNLKPEDMYLRKPEFLKALDIEFWPEKEVPELSPQWVILFLPWGGCDIDLCIHGCTCGKWERTPAHLISPECPETRHTGTGKTECGSEVPV